MNRKGYEKPTGSRSRLRGTRRFMAPPPNRQSSVYLAWRLASCGLVVGRASYGGIVLRCPTGRRSGGGASIGHRLEREYEAGYTGAQESRRCYTAKAPNAAGTLGADNDEWPVNRLL